MGEPEPGLISLAEHDRCACERYHRRKEGKQPNGIACPLCGRQLVDTDPGMLMLSSPPQTRIECLHCKWGGARVV